jgi:N-acetylglucosamine-6-phosphate deacetylase
MRLGVSRAIVEGALVGGDVEIQAGRVTAVGLSSTGGSGIAAPGFVDMQVNGFAGIDFAAAQPADYGEVGSALAATGVVAYQPTLITLPETGAVTALRSMAAHRPDRPGPRIIGMHLEGPFLSPLRAGAHDPASIIDPDLALAGRLLAAGPVTMMTLAPERPGALDLIDFLTAQGVVVSCGHSDATAPEAHAAFDRGATAVTHLFGAQRPVHHRDPGIAVAALTRGEVTVSIILDGFHLDPDIVRLALASPARVALITDAIAAAGQPDGTYPLGDRSVIVEAGSARLEDRTLAGSVLSMDAAVRNLIDIGADLTEAVGAATAIPAAVVGRDDLGRLTVGATADIVVLTDDLEVQRTLVGGVEVFSAS